MEQQQQTPAMQMTMAEWQKASRDFRSIIDGQRYALQFIPGKGTCLVPVEIVKPTTTKEQ